MDSTPRAVLDGSFDLKKSALGFDPSAGTAQRACFTLSIDLPAVGSSAPASPLDLDACQPDIPLRRPQTLPASDRHHDRDRDTTRQELRGKASSEGMESYRGKAAVRTKVPQYLRLLALGPIREPRKDKSGGLGRVSQVVEKSGELFVNWDIPPVPPFRRSDRPTFPFVEGLVDVDHLARHVDRRPPKREELSAPHPGKQGKCPNGIPWIYQRAGSLLRGGSEHHRAGFLPLRDDGRRQRVSPGQEHGWSPGFDCRLLTLGPAGIRRPEGWGRPDQSHPGHDGCLARSGVLI